MVPQDLQRLSGKITAAMPHLPVQYAGRDLEAMFSAPRYCSWILSQVRPYVGKMVAEVGAGSGNFSAQLMTVVAGRIVAVEPSAQMFPLLERRFKGDGRIVCEQGFLSDVASRYRGAFDTVVYANVLEHVEDDRREMNEARGVLKPGGYLCVFVPALPWLYSAFDMSVGHHRRYAKRQLTVLMQEAGFEIVKVNYFDIAGILPWFFFMRIFGWTLTPGRAGLYDRIAVPLMRTIESLISPPIGKNLVIVGRRPML